MDIQLPSRLVRLYCTSSVPSKPTPPASRAEPAKSQAFVAFDSSVAGAVMVISGAVVSMVKFLEIMVSRPEESLATKLSSHTPSSEWSVLAGWA